MSVLRTAREGAAVTWGRARDRGGGGNVSTREGYVCSRNWKGGKKIASGSARQRDARLSAGNFSFKGGRKARTLREGGKGHHRKKSCG